MTITHICGSFVVQAHGSFLNGSGSVKEGKENISMPKFFLKNGLQYPYISAQCWRRWWKTTFYDQFSNYIDSSSEEKQLQDPFVNATDDLFGYFEGTKKKIDITEVNKINVSQIRSSPVQMTQLHPIQEAGLGQKALVLKDKAYVHLKEGTPLPYTSRFYNADLQAIIAIDLERIGKYHIFNDRQELAKETIAQYLQKKILDEESKNRYKIRINEKIKKQRIKILLESLLIINGGAKNPQYGTDITPKIIILAGQNGANPLLSNIFEMGEEKIVINFEKLIQKVKGFKAIFETPIYLGFRTDFLENSKQILEQKADIIEKMGVPLIIGSPMEIVRKLMEANV